MIRSTIHARRRPVLFNLFRKKNKDGASDQIPVAVESVAEDHAEAESTDEAKLEHHPSRFTRGENGAGAATVTLENVGATADEEPFADDEPGPAFDEEVAERTEQALGRTKRGFFRRMLGVFERSQIDDALWEELEELLIGADTGYETTERILDSVRETVRKEGMKQPEEVREALKAAMIAMLEAVDVRGQLWGDAGDEEREFKPAVILVVGVNGVGKTTSIAKLARAFRRDGEKVVLAAGDTFRAAAIEQLETWGQRTGATVIAHQQGEDASAVVFDAMASAKRRGADVVLVDTAGRLHTKSNLMEELRKINRVVQKSDETAPHEVLLVIDAVTGQNGLMQAKTFAEAVGVTSIFLTKLDGTARGGIVFSIADQLGIPVRFIGTGERADDMAPFDPAAFVNALFSE
jgi:fused signal recognition particle receptor